VPVLAKKLLKKVRAPNRLRVPVHLELASSTDPEFMRGVVSALFGEVDSLGFNEQECAFLFEALGGRYSPSGPASSRSEIASNTPSPRAVAGVLRFLLESFPSLSRLHFHSISFHLVAYRSKSTAKYAVDTKAWKKSAGTYRALWRGGASAVAAGSVAVTAEACQRSASQLSSNDVKLGMPLEFAFEDLRKPGANATKEVRLSSLRPVVSWSWEASSLKECKKNELRMCFNENSVERTTNSTDADFLVEFHLAPVVVCASPSSTVGLGDTVSSAGLVYDVVKIK
jgi:ADP-dependent phosphofructokinase/glucokinase